MNWFLFKTEPSEFSYADLERAGRVLWEGVSSPAALIAMRAVRRGDEIFIYHTGAQRAIAGLARAASDPREDPARPGCTERGEPKFAVLDIEPVAPAVSPVKLNIIRSDRRFARFPLVTQGRLSAMAVPPALAALLRGMMGV